MQRRKLTAYTIMYIAGISAGYFIFERGRAAEAFCFLTAVSLAALFADRADGAEKSRIRRHRLIMIAFTLSGFLMFAARYAYYASLILPSGGMEHEETVTMTGAVISASVKNAGTELTVRMNENGRRLLVYTGSEDLGSIASDADLTDIYSLTGSLIRAEGVFREFSRADNPGAFDYALHMRAKGVSASFRAESIDIIESSGGMLPRLRRYLFRSRDAFTESFDDETSGFIKGVIFGDKSSLDEDITQEFNMNSTGHILAVSGLHIGFLYSLLRLMSGRRRTLPVSLLIIAVLVIYGEMTLWSAATARACLVMSISMMSLHLRRPFDLLTAVSAAALVILTAEPYQLFDAGFQMSFLAMTGIAVFKKPLSSAAGEALGLMTAVQLSMIPVTAYTFYRVNLLSLFINIPVILLASVLVPLCILLLLISMAAGSAPAAGIGLAELISYAVIRINHFLSFGGSFSYRVAGLGGAAVTAFYAASFGLASEWMRVRLLRREYRRALRSAVCVMIPLFFLSACMFDRFSDDGIVFVSVGQGDCVHVRADGHDVLIDGGGREDRGSGGQRYSFNTGEKILMPYLLRSGADRLDIALVTHLHADHCKGICELDAVYPVGAIGIPVDYRGAEAMLTGDEGAVDSKGGEADAADADKRSPVMEKLMYIMPDTRVELSDDVFIEVLWPKDISEDPVAADDPNEHNTVYMIYYNGIKVMVTGDLLEKDELEMLEHYRSSGNEAALKCDVLKAAHHGSRSSSCEAFLDAAAPKIAVIQAGRNNIYGHPHQQTLDRLEERGIKVFRTDQNGAVGIDIRRGRLSVDLFRK